MSDIEALLFADRERTGRLRRSGMRPGWIAVVLGSRGGEGHT